jgi:hypothetical protein
VSYIIQRGRWCDIVVLNIHAQTAYKIDYVKDFLYEELKRVFYKFPKYRTKILSGDFSAKVGGEDIFKPAVGSKSLHESSNDSGGIAVNFGTSKNLTVESTVFPHRNIHKFTWIYMKGRDTQDEPCFEVQDRPEQQTVILPLPGGGKS